MIPYTNNFRDHKPYVYLGLAIAAFLTWELLGWAAQELKTLQIAGLPALTVPFSVMTTLYLGYLTLFDHFLWHLWPIRWLLRIPNLTGEWLGERFRGDETEPSGRFTVTIKQTWSHISIETRNADPKSKAPPTSTSMSTSASFVTSDMSGVEFLFTYTYKRLTGGGGSGEGTQRWRLSADRQRLEGFYYSTRTLAGHERLTRI